MVSRRVAIATIILSVIVVSTLGVVIFYNTTLSIGKEGLCKLVIMATSIEDLWPMGYLSIYLTIQNQCGKQVTLYDIDASWSIVVYRTHGSLYVPNNVKSISGELPADIAPLEAVTYIVNIYNNFFYSIDDELTYIELPISIHTSIGDYRVVYRVNTTEYNSYIITKMKLWREYFGLTNRSDLEITNIRVYTSGNATVISMDVRSWSDALIILQSLCIDDRYCSHLDQTLTPSEHIHIATNISYVLDPCREHFVVIHYYSLTGLHKLNNTVFKKITLTKP